VADACTSAGFWSALSTWAVSVWSLVTWQS
jgi:hypothetical protein